jgi:hypothetical protein
VVVRLLAVLAVVVLLVLAVVLVVVAVLVVLGVLAVVRGAADPWPSPARYSRKCGWGSPRECSQHRSHSTQRNHGRKVRWSGIQRAFRMLDGRTGGKWCWQRLRHPPPSHLLVSHRLVSHQTHRLVSPRLDVHRLPHRTPRLFPRLPLPPPLTFVSTSRPS